MSPRTSTKDLLLPSKPHPLLQPTRSQWPVLWGLVERILDQGYNEQSVSQAMGLKDHSERNFFAWPAHIRHCRRHPTPCAQLAAFFLAEETLQANLLSDLLGHEGFELLLDLQWIVPNAEGLVFRYYLYPLMGKVFLTDGHISNPNHLDQVYQLGGDSHLLARLAVRPQAGLTLDHCTGSGVHAILASVHANRSFGLDINPRALDFSRLNARMNRRDNLSFLLSNCYDNVTTAGLGLDSEPIFDLITANPPFVPTPDAIALCRGGGVSGEEVTEKIVRGLPQKLSANGIFSMITNIPVLSGSTFFQRCDEWLDDRHAWSIVVFHTNHTPTPVYIQAHLGPRSPVDYGPVFEQWLQSYQAAGVIEMTTSQVYIFRSSYPWRIEHDGAYVHEVQTSFIENWIKALRAYGSNAQYQIHPGLKTIQSLDNATRYFLEWPQEHRWWQPQNLWLEGLAAQAFHRVRAAPQTSATDHDIKDLLMQNLLFLCESE